MTQFISKAQLLACLLVISFDLQWIQITPKCCFCPILVQFDSEQEEKEEEKKKRRRGKKKKKKKKKRKRRRK